MSAMSHARTSSHQTRTPLPQTTGHPGPHDQSRPDTEGHPALHPVETLVRQPVPESAVRGPVAPNRECEGWMRSARFAVWHNIDQDTRGGATDSSGR